MRRVVLITASAAAILAAVLAAGFSSSGTVRAPVQPVSTSGYATAVAKGAAK
jgi:hypothetical protein